MVNGEIVMEITGKFLCDGNDWEVVVCGGEHGGSFCAGYSLSKGSEEREWTLGEWN